MIQYAKDRDEAIVESIRADSVEPFKKFIEKYSIIFPDCFTPPTDDILAISIRQMALHCTEIEPEIKGRAVEWLINNHHDLDFTK